MAEQKYYGDGFITGYGASKEAGLCFRAGFHRVRRLALRDQRGEDRQDHGSGGKVGAPVIGLNDSGGARIQKA